MREEGALPEAQLQIMNCLWELGGTAMFGARRSRNTRSKWGFVSIEQSGGRRDIRLPVL